MDEPSSHSPLLHQLVHSGIIPKVGYDLGCQWTTTMYNMLKEFTFIIVNIQFKFWDSTLVLAGSFEYPKANWIIKFST